MSCQTSQKEARCCYWGLAYNQAKEISIVSYEQYKYFRDNTKGFTELAAFAAGVGLFGVRRSGAAEAAQSYPGEYVSGNYFKLKCSGINARRNGFACSPPRTIDPMPRPSW